MKVYRLVNLTQLNPHEWLTNRRRLLLDKLHALKISAGRRFNGPTTYLSAKGWRVCIPNVIYFEPLLQGRTLNHRYIFVCEILVSSWKRAWYMMETRTLIRCKIDEAADWSSMGIWSIKDQYPIPTTET